MFQNEIIIQQVDLNIAAVTSEISFLNAEWLTLKCAEEAETEL